MLPIYQFLKTKDLPFLQKGLVYIVFLQKFNFLVSRQKFFKNKMQTIQTHLHHFMYEINLFLNFSVTQFYSHNPTSYKKLK